MFRHGPNCLEGPVTRERSWWLGPVDERTPADVLRHCSERSDTMEQPVGETIFPDPEIRHELVARIRREIAQGTYETPEKWESALERLWQRLEAE